MASESAHWEAGGEPHSRWDEVGQRKGLGEIIRCKKCLKVPRCMADKDGVPYR